MGNYGGTGVVDGYGAYNDYTRQRDWEHLRREVKDTKIEDTVTHYHELYDRAKKMKEKPPPERERFIGKAQDSEFPELIATLRENEKEDTATKLENALPDMFRGERGLEHRLGGGAEVKVDFRGRQNNSGIGRRMRTLNLKEVRK